MIKKILIFLLVVLTSVHSIRAEAQVTCIDHKSYEAILQIPEKTYKFFQQQEKQEENIKNIPHARDIEFSTETLMLPSSTISIKFTDKEIQVLVSNQKEEPIFYNINLESIKISKFEGGDLKNSFVNFIVNIPSKNETKRVSLSIQDNFEFLPEILKLHKKLEKLSAQSEVRDD